MLRVSIAAVLLTCAVAGVSKAADDKPLTVDDHFTLGTVNESAISADSKQIAYTEGRWQESTNDRNNDIWLVADDGETPRRLTADRRGYKSLRWSVDGRRLYYLSTEKRAGEEKPPYDGTEQVWSLDVSTSQATSVTRVDGGIKLYDLSRDGGWLAYATSSNEDEGDWAALRKKFNQVGYGTVKRPQTTISRLDLKTWRTTTITRYSGAISDLSIAPDGKHLGLVTGPDATVAQMEGGSNATVVNVDDGTARDLTDDAWRKTLASPYGRINQVKWSGDGTALAFDVGFDGYPSEVVVADQLTEPRPRLRTVPRPDGMSLHGGVGGGTGLAWRGDSHDLCFLGDDHGRVRIYCAKKGVDDEPTVESLTPGDVVVERFSWDRNGDVVAAVIGRPDRMHDIHLGSRGKWKRITEINAHTNDWALPKISIVRWKGADGTMVEGVLELPPNYQKGERLPTIVNLHGGPTSAWPYNMTFGFSGGVLFASQGYAYLSPNYRGSTGYGDKFLTDLLRHENDVEVADILAGVDYLVKEGIADPDRLGVSGWSNGGYLTNCLIAKTDRFKAASSGASFVDVTTEWGTNDEPAYPLVFIGGPPWQFAEDYRRTSPLFDFGKVKTPTLFHVGEKDVRCPKGNSETAFRALKHHLKVPTELLVYPGEPHGIGGHMNRKAKMTWDLAWFDHYLKGRPLPK